MLNTVKVPKQFEPIFQKAQDYVAKFFSAKKEDPSNGTIEVFGERYVLVRAASMSVDFFETIAGLYEKEGKQAAENIARQLLFDIAHAIGKQDARNFHQKMHLQDPIERLSIGPVHFAHTGWAFVDIFPESSPTPDEDYYLIYDHPYSFESAAWHAAGKSSEFPVCIMNAGYSSGWCEESFGLGLVATEIMCQAKGDHACRFIMAPPSRMEEHIAAYMRKESELAKRISKYEVPGFFKRKEAEEALRESEQRFRNVFDFARDIIFTVDLDMRYTSLNPAFERVSGWPCAEWLGKSFLDVVHPDDLSMVTKIFQEGLKGEIPPPFELRMRKKSGDYFDAEFTVAPLTREGKLVGFIGVGREVTERKRAEEKIRKLNDELAAKVQELLAAQEELVRKEKLALLGQVADTVGHELRNPLGVMNNAVYFLQTVLVDADETTREYLGIIKDEIADAERIVSDLLDAVRTKPPHPEIVEVAELMQQVLRKCDIPPSVAVRVEIPETIPAIRVDPAQMHQVFWNLVTNGVEAMPDGGTLEIRADENPAAKTVTVRIKDSGCGIPQEDQAKLFQPMFTTKTRRIGLGLVVVKKLTQANGGSVGMESEAGKGSTFSVTLPGGGRP